MCLCLVVFFGKYEGTSNQTCPSCTKMCCLDVLDIARCLLLQPPMQCQKTWLCICKKKSSRWLDIWDMVKSVFFSASNATPKKQWLWVGKILHQGLMRSWLSVDDCLTNTGNKTGWQITPKPTYTFFSSNVFLERIIFIDLLWQSSSSAQIRL